MKKSSLGIFILSMFLISCSKSVYLNNMLPEIPYDAQSTELLIRKGDQLSITVTAKNAEVAAPFNVHSGMSYKISEDSKISTVRTGDATNVQGGYIVDDFGSIQFPVLGDLSINNMTCREVESLISEKLVQNKYIEEPVVRVDVYDAKITVMGEVASKGMLSLSSKGMNLLDAISLSGGLTNNAATNKVKVIRQREGTRIMYETDICSTELLESPCFALQQNDIVYVQPRSAQVTDREERGLRIFSVTTGLASLVISLLLLLK